MTQTLKFDNRPTLAKTGTVTKLKPHQKQLTHEIAELTPDTCALILDDNPSSEIVPPKAVQEYADAMSAGAWVYNGQPILFDKNEKLVDGRKRLMASVLSGVTIRTLVVRGVHPDTIHTIDQHRRRSYTCVIESRGVKNAATIVRTMAKLIRIERGLFGKPADHISWSRYDQVLELNPDLKLAVSMSEKARGCPLHSTARPVIAYMALVSGRPELAEMLFEETSNHELLARGTPSKELALQLAHDRRRGIKPEVDEMIVMGIQAINDIIHGRECEAPYGWTRDYGACRLDANGLPTSRQSFIDTAPENLGMPVMEGYPGIDMGVDLVDAESAMIKAMQSKGGGITSDAQLHVAQITPEIAAGWLKKFNLSNRKILKSHVNAIARDIRNGHWMMNAQPITFNGDPFTGEALLLNGQHRLKAVIASGVSVEMMVATGVEKEAFMTYDTHSRHTHGKFVTQGDERVLAAAAKLQWREDNGKSPFDSVTPSAMEIRHTIEKHPSLLDAFRFSRKQEMQIIGSSGILTYFVSKISREDDQLSKTYLDQLMSGENLGEANPVNKTRTKLIGKRGDLTRKEVLHVLLESWNEYCEHAKRVGLAKLYAVKRAKKTYA